jgi:hypothetical protein
MRRREGAPWGIEGTASWLHPAPGAALAVADVIIPAVIAIVVLTAILRGSTKTCERVFRPPPLDRRPPRAPRPPAERLHGVTGTC